MSAGSTTSADAPAPAAVDARDGALRQAAQRGHVDSVARELARGADVDATDVTGASPLTLAAACGHTDVVRALLTAGASPVAAPASPLIAAARGGDRAIVELLLDHGAPVDPRDHLGRDPLHWAAASGHRDVVELLLDRGADPAALDLDGVTPLHLAAGNPIDPEVVRVLIERGGRVDLVDHSGATPLDFAEREGERELMAAMRQWAATP